MFNQSSNTEVLSWTIRDLVDARNGQSNKKRLIKIPTYQRNLVWSKKQQKELIASIKKWFPIWAMLLYKAKNESGIDVYHLIDWLQRSTAFKEYLAKPTSFLDEEDIPDAIYLNIFEVVSKHSIVEWLEEKIKLTIKTWLSSLEWFDIDKWYAPKHLISQTESALSIKLNRDEFELLLDKLDPFFVQIKEESSIDSQLIPILIYNGDISNLPIIFEKLNHGWTQLSKYQVYAATWSLSEHYMIIENSEIVKKIKDKYQALEDKWLILEKEDEITNKSKFNYFEYFFGLWKYLNDEFSSKLFEVGKNWDDTDSIWFNLGALCLGEDLKKMDKLPKVINDNSIDINKFTDAIYDSIKITWSILEPYIGLKANSKTGRISSIYHSEMQIVSIIGKVFNSKYNNKTFEVRSEWKTKKSLLEKNIPFHYLKQILQWYWSGTGDAKANDLAKLTNKTYEESISRQSWEAIFESFNESENAKKEVLRANISPTSILLFKFIYGKLVYQHDVLKNDFEIEHLCAVSRLKETASKMWKDEWLPISAIGNLCLIEKEKNRDKWNKTFYEFFDWLVKSWEKTEKEVQDELKDLEQNRIFTTQDQLNFMKDFSVDKIGSYIAFINDRFKTIKELFYQKNNIV